MGCSMRDADAGRALPSEASTRNNLAANEERGSHRLLRSAVATTQEKPALSGVLDFLYGDQPAELTFQDICVFHADNHNGEIHDWQ